MAKNYYLILGVATDASLEEIKSAFRRRALELHPDRSGLESGPFLDVREAHGVLSDPERRRHYDQSTIQPAIPHRPWGPAPEPMLRARPRGEPMRMRSAGQSGTLREVQPDRSFERFAPSFDELFDRWWSNFETISRPKAEELRSLTLELVLSPAEAQSGGRIRVHVPARATCPTCAGRGAVGPYECWRCEGHGALTADYPMHVDYPAGIRDGHAVRIPLNRFGIENFYLTVLFRISAGRPW